MKCVTDMGASDLCEFDYMWYTGRCSFVLRKNHCWLESNGRFFEKMVVLLLKSFSEFLVCHALVDMFKGF